MMFRKLDRFIERYLHYAVLKSQSLWKRFSAIVIVCLIVVGYPIGAYANPAVKSVKPALKIVKTLERSKIWQNIIHTRAWQIGEYGIARVKPFTGPAILLLLVVVAGKLVKDKLRDKREVVLSGSADSNLSPVGVAVVAPEEVKRNDDVMVQVVGNAIKLLDNTISEAMSLDEKNRAKLRGRCAFVCKEQDKIDFRLTVSGIKFDTDAQSVVWLGSDFKLQFLAHVPKDAELGNHNGRLQIFIRNTPVGQIGFTTQVVRSVRSTRRNAETVCANFKNYFISYSSKDLNTVVSCLQGMRLTDKDIIKHSFLDKMFLDPGNHYEPIIYDYIDNKADVFLLFWSKNAAASEWVKKEIDRALARQRKDVDAVNKRPEIIPVPIESPVPPPPEELADLHFGDALVALKR